MSVFKRGRRTALRLAIGAGLLAAPFVAAGTAQAAIGLGQAPNLGFHADLLNVHVLGGVNGNRAEFCFDKPVSSPTPGATANFRLMGYRWDTVLLGNSGVPTVLDTSTATCPAVQGGNAGSGVIVQLNTQTTASPGSNQAQLNQYTIGSVLASTVTANVSAGVTNIGDSAPLIESTSKAGTRGNTAGPNLQLVAFGTPNGTNELTFVFDKNVDVNGGGSPPPFFPTPGDFGYINAAGTQFLGGAITGVGGTNPGAGLDHNAVRVSFGATTNVSDAVQAFVARGGPPNSTSNDGRDNAGTPSTLADTQSVIPVGPSGPASGVSTRPSLVSNEESGSNTMDFTFDQNVTLCGGTPAAPSNGPLPPANPPAVGSPNNCATSGLNAAAASDFFAVASNGDETQGSNATVLASDGKTVRVTFAGTHGNTNNYEEEIVAGSVYPSAVTSANNGAENAAGGKAAGTNVGNSTGYTNAPDANSVVFNSSSGTATVTFDQRVAGSSGTAGAPVGPDGTTTTPLTSWRLLDKNGNLLQTPTGATVNTTGFISTVTLTFSQPNLLGPSVAGALEIVGNQTSSDTTNMNPYNSSFVASPASAVYSFGAQHASGVSGMNPAGNVQQVLAPTFTSALFAQVRHLKLKRVHITNKHAKHTKHTKHHRRSHHR